MVGSPYLYNQHNLAVAPGWTAELLFFLSNLPSLAEYLFDATDGAGNTMGSIAITAAGIIQGFPGGAILNSPAATTAQVWHHVAVDSNAAASHLYVDGTLVATGAGSAGTFNPGFGIGARVNPLAGSPMAGAIAEVAYYGAVIGGARVSAHFNAIDNVLAPPVAGAEGGLVGVTLGASIYSGLLQEILKSVKKIY